MRLAKTSKERIARKAKTRLRVFKAILSIAQTSVKTTQPLVCVITWPMLLQLAMVLLFFIIIVVVIAATLFES